MSMCMSLFLSFFVAVSVLSPNVGCHLQSLATPGEGDLGQAVGCPGKKKYIYILFICIVQVFLHISEYTQVNKR